MSKFIDHFFPIPIQILKNVVYFKTTTKSQIVTDL